jgi:hypothetical protein
METKAEKVAKRRAELLKSYEDKFEALCVEEDKNTSLPATEKLQNAVRVLDFYIQNLMKEKPQETSFYTSVALEFQRNMIKKLDFIRKKNHPSVIDVKEA